MIVFSESRRIPSAFDRCHMRFIDDGPSIPEALIREHLAGDVIFVVGAGLSRPSGLPTFEGLVSSSTAEPRSWLSHHRDFLGAPCVLEKHACENKAWDRVFRLLERRYGYFQTSRPNKLNKVRQSVSSLLDLTGKITKAHEDILTLSSNTHGYPTVITTNFDTLFEHAWKTKRHDAIRSLAQRPRVCRRPFRLNDAAMAGSLICA